MYDYRNDLLNIIQNIDDTDEGLIRGRETLRSAMHLIQALPLDSKHQRKDPTIHHHEPSHFHAINGNEKHGITKSAIKLPSKQTQSLNGHQYEALNKLKGIRQSLAKLKNGQVSKQDSPSKLAHRYHKITNKLSDEDKRALSDQLKPIHQDFNQLGLKYEHHLDGNNSISVKNLAQHTQVPSLKHKSAVSQSKKPSEMELNSKIPFSSQKRQYVVQRELNGATLLTENGQDAGHLSENIARQMNLHSGTIVKADIMPNDIFVHKVLRHIDHLGKTTFDDKNQICTFEFGVVKKHKHHLRVTYNSNNEPLLVNGKKHAFLLDLDNPIVGDGSIVELAWYKDDPDSMRIRWTYPTETPVKDDQATKQTKQQNKGNLSTDKDNQTITKRYSDLDLNSKTVAVLVGNRQEHEDYERLIKLYNGQPTVIDSFKTQKSYLRNKLKSADIVVLVKSKAHHGASKAVAEFQDQYGFAFAVADTLAMGQFEDALYRARHGLPADTASMTNLH